MCTKWRKLEISTKTDTPLKLLNESLKYLEEKDWKLLFNEGISESYMFDSYFGDLPRFLRRLRDLELCNAYPIPIPSVPNGFDELMDLADVNRRIHENDEKTWYELIEKYSEDPLVISEENEEALTYYLTLFILNHS